MFPGPGDRSASRSYERASGCVERIAALSETACPQRADIPASVKSPRVRCRINYYNASEDVYSDWPLLIPNEL
jgi:hypothetical protein